VPLQLLVAEVTGGGILLLLKVFFGMRGQQGRLKEIVAMKQNSTSVCS
jgi:glycine C-acetyltransferase